jgi:hypothetical protein
MNLLMKMDLQNPNSTGREPACGRQGFGAFSYSHSHLDNVIRYIMNQKEHHRKKTFKEEYITFLKKFEIPHEEQHLFDWLY